MAVAPGYGRARENTGGLKPSPVHEVAKHDRAKQEKRQRNAAYALTFRQKRCKECGHRSSSRGDCTMCGGKMK
jgi:hypothetical protein